MAGPVAMDLSVDPPFERNEPARMLDDGAVDVVDEDLLGPHCALFRAGARTDEACVGAGHADRDVAEHADSALQVQHARQSGRLLAQDFVFAHSILNFAVTA